MQIEGIDHVVITARDVKTTADFYAHVLGMRVELHEAPDQTFHYGALYFGQQKINLHQLGHEFDPKARLPTPGAADLCFVTTANPEQIIERLQACGVQIVEGPVLRTGACGPMTSIYIRDPDQNLVEIAHYG